MKKLRLFTPGPTMVPEEVMLEMARPMVHHRTEVYREMHKELHELLQYDLLEKIGERVHCVSPLAQLKRRVDTRSTLAAARCGT